MGFFNALAQARQEAARRYQPPNYSYVSNVRDTEIEEEEKKDGGEVRQQQEE